MVVVVVVVTAIFIRRLLCFTLLRKRFPRDAGSTGQTEIGVTLALGNFAWAGTRGAVAAALTSNEANRTKGSVSLHESKGHALKFKI